MSQASPFALDEDALLFGRIAVENGLCTSDQLSDALMAQMEDPTRRIGALLVDAGALTMEQAAWVLEKQGEEGKEPPAPTLAEVPPEMVETMALETASLADTQPSAVPLAAEVPVMEPPSTEPLMAVAAPVDSTVDTIAMDAAVAEAAPAPPLEAVPLAVEPAALAEPIQVVDVAPAAQPIPVAEPTEPVSTAAPDPPAAVAQPVAAPQPVQPAQAPAAAAAAAPIQQKWKTVGHGDWESSAAPELDELIGIAVERGASDLHLHATVPVKVRVNGTLVDLEGRVSETAQNQRILDAILPPSLHQAMAETGQVDFSHTVAGKARLRCNAYRQQNGTDIVFRIVPPAPPSLEELGLPESLAKLAHFHQGMVLFTGPTGCGKSSTLAAVVDLVNQDKPDHILTVEDPIEYIHPSKVCLVNQRQVNNHTGSFARALRGALREDPDVIVIGELRDHETISLALTAAETGHLVLGTMHTLSAIATVSRLIGAFPPEEQSQIRTMVSESLRAVVSQRLVVKADGSGRVPAVEVLMLNMAIANLIREEKTFQIPGLMQSGRKHGMCLLDQSLVNLMKEKKITKEEALRVCDNPKTILAGA